MWYLIVPPIVIVLSVLFALWYLSRKGVDPVVVDKISQLESTAGEQIAFSRTKHFSLHLLEKMTYRFKVMSLRMHNTLSDMTQSLKEKQKHFQKPISVQEEVSDEGGDAIETNDTEIPVIRRSRVERFRIFEKQENTRVSLDVQSDVVKDIQPSAPVEQEQEQDALRPMVSEAMVRPERISVKKKSVSVAQEETLIAHIAVNPKDFSAYEELGDYYLEIGNIKDAKECYRQVLRLSPVQRMAKIKIRRLEKILLQKEV